MHNARCRLISISTAFAAIWCLLSFTFIWTGCRGSSSAPAASKGERLVTVGGAVTEIVFALGRGDSVIGVDTSSLFPAVATHLPKVGYQRTIAAEGILALRPTRVLVSDEAGPPAAIDQLRQAGISISVIPSTPTTDGARTKILTIARLLGVPDRGAQLVQQLDKDLEHANQLTSDSRRVLFLYARGGGTLLVGGSATQVDEMIRLAGATNTASAVHGYKPFSAEALLQARPDVLLLTSRGLESLGGLDGVRRLPGLALLPPVQQPAVIILDDLLLLGFGPRLGQAVAELRQKLAATSRPLSTLASSVRR